MDIKIDNAGDLIIENEDLVIINNIDYIKQDIYAELCTVKEDLFYIPNYGLSIIEYINSNQYDLNEVTMIIKNRLQEREYITEVVTYIEYKTIYLEIYINDSNNPLIFSINDEFAVSEEL